MSSPIPDKFGVQEVVKHSDEIRDSLRFYRQLKNLDVIMPSGELRRIQRTEKAVNALLDLRAIGSEVSTVTTPRRAPDRVYQNETLGWEAAAVGVGGLAPHATTLDQVDDFFIAMKRTSFFYKVQYFMAFAGLNLEAQFYPVINRITNTLPVNTGFFPADCSQANGLQGGVGKYLTFGFDANAYTEPGTPGTGSNKMGGVFYWETAPNFGGTGSVVAGVRAAGGERFSVELLNGSKSFYWGSSANGATHPVATESRNYFGIRASATSRKLFVDGALVATNTASDAASGMDLTKCGLMGSSSGQWPGRCRFAGFVDATMTDAEVAAFHAILITFKAALESATVPTNETIPTPDPTTEETASEADLNRVLTSKTGEVLVSRTGQVLLSRATS